MMAKSTSITVQVERPYDSRPDTYRHIGRVRHYLTQFIVELLDRAQAHDASKLESPEKEGFDALEGNMKGLTYGSAEYRAGLKANKPAIDHHYAHNSHHPEHFPNGIQGMNLLDVVEMLADWKAASERHENGDFAASIEYNQGRFGYSDDLKAIFINTIPVLEQE